MGLCLLFLPNFPGATFIQGGTFIPESRVTSRQIQSGLCGLISRIWLDFMNQIPCTEIRKLFVE